MTEGAWHARLRDARRACGLTQAELARMAGLSMQTVRAYERNRRHPTRAHLATMLGALRIGTHERNGILVAAGFAPEGVPARRRAAGQAYSAAEAAQEAERYRWPAFVTDEVGTVLSANCVAQRLWDVDLSLPAYADPASRNMLTVMSDPTFADRFLNWDEGMATVIGAWKGRWRTPEDLERPSPQFRVLLDRFLQGEPRYVARFMELWREAGDPVAKIRWSYPVRWLGGGGAILRFHSFVSTANEEDELSFHDWIPTDGATWAALESLSR